LGSGEVGIHLARQFEAAGMEVVLVDRDPAALAVAEESVDALTTVGDVTHWDVLRRANVASAGLVVAVTASDEVNLVAAGLAAQVGARHTIARADATGLYRNKAAVETNVLGVSFVLCASRLLALELLRLLRGRSASYVADFAAHAVRVCAVILREHSPEVGEAASKIGGQAGKQIAAVIREGVLRLPTEIERLEAGDRLLLAGEPGDVAEAQARLRDTLRKHSVVVIGGGDVGAQLAEHLCLTERRVHIIERDLERCQQLSELLPKATIIHGDGTTIALLRDQQVETAYAVMACTKSDDANLMASLLAKDLGVPNTFAVTHRHGYADVYAHLGVSASIGPHDAIGTMVKSLAPRDGVLQRAQLPDCSHEIVEYELEAVGARASIEDLSLPSACVLLAVARDHAIVELDSSLRLQKRDHLVIAQPLHARKEMMRRLASFAEARR
jgi:trk system potassium uptake protein TrkA